MTRRKEKEPVSNTASGASGTGETRSAGASRLKRFLRRDNSISNEGGTYRTQPIPLPQLQRRQSPEEQERAWSERNPWFANHLRYMSGMPAGEETRSSKILSSPSETEQRSSLQLLQITIHHEPGIDARDSRGETELFRTITSVVNEIKKLGDKRWLIPRAIESDLNTAYSLISRGADVNAVNNERRRAFDRINFFDMKNSDAIPVLLLSAELATVKADLSKRAATATDQDSLFKSVRWGHLETAKVYLENGAEADIMDKSGKTLLMTAIDLASPALKAGPPMYPKDQYKWYWGASTIAYLPTKDELSSFVDLLVDTLAKPYTSDNTAEALSKAREKVLQNLARDVVKYEVNNYSADERNQFSRTGQLVNHIPFRLASVLDGNVGKQAEAYKLAQYIEQEIGEARKLVR